MQVMNINMPMPCMLASDSMHHLLRCESGNHLYGKKARSLLYDVMTCRLWYVHDNITFYRQNMSYVACHDHELGEANALAGVLDCVSRMPT
jgi:hypothetical protein